MSAADGGERTDITGAEDHPLVDDDGYPTEWGIAAVRHFHGSPTALVDLLEQLWWTPSLMTVDEWLDNQLRNVVRVSLATGGWSGNETVIDALDKSRFHLLYLGVKSSRRAARVYGPSDRVGDGQRARRSYRGERRRVARTGSGRWPVRKCRPPTSTTPTRHRGGVVDVNRCNVATLVVVDLSVGAGSVLCCEDGPSGPVHYSSGGDSVMTDLDTTVTVIDAAARAHVPVLLWSDPGMGKSSIVRALAAADGVPVETVIGSQREPVDIAGWPVVTDGAVQTLALPDWAKTLLDANGGYLLLDEISTCSASVQAAMLTVALERMVGRTKLPDAVRIVAAANPPDRSAGGVDLTPPMANRFLHVDFEPTAEEWLTGMRSSFAALPASRGIAADDLRRADEIGAVCAFVEARPALLHQFPDTDEAAGRAWPSRRSWEAMARVLAHLRADDTAAISAVALGLVGDGAGSEFMEWRASMDLPAVADVIADPSIVAWGTARPDQVWAVLSGVVAWASGRGTKDAWMTAWGPVVEAATHGAPDVAGAAARALSVAMPAGAKPPAAARKFKDVMIAAGLDVGSAA